MKNKKNSTYRIPEGFNPWQAFDNLCGIVDAADHYITEGPASAEHDMDHATRTNVESLLRLLKREIHTLRDYFTALGDETTLKLPLTDADFEAVHVKHAKADEVKESAAIYAIK
jgi:hypothetical protein